MATSIVPIWIQTAASFAIAAHGNQKYGDSHPYSFHLQAVEYVLIEYGFERDILLRIAAWLHDVIEDTETTAEQIEETFGPVVRALVEAVTTESGINRKERNAKTYPKIKAIPMHMGIILKLADRIANVRNCIATNNVSLLSMYKKEHPGFRGALYDDYSVTTPMWTELDRILEYVNEPF